MPPEVRDSTDPREWLRRARSNLALARAGGATPEVLYEDLCFEAQQAAEKAVKALLVLRQAAFPKTHVIGELLTLVDRSGIPVGEGLWEAADLTVYAVRVRYPGEQEDVPEEEYAQALELAELVVRWAEEIVGGGPA